MDFKQKGKAAAKGSFKRKVQSKERYKNKYGTKSTEEGLAAQRKTAVEHKYRKILRKDQQQHLKSRVKMQKIYQEAGEELTSSQKRKGREKVSSFHKEEMKWKIMKKEKEQKRQEVKQQQEEKDKALKKYKENKKLVHKKLAKKNYKGQPNMAAQMEVLLKKIEASKS